MEEFIEASFEGHKVSIMKGYDDYLKTVYGNYMQLPPADKRVSTHTIKAFEINILAIIKTKGNPCFSFLVAGPEV